MSDRGSDQTEAVLPFAPKLNPRSDLSDPLEKAGHLIWDMVRQASGNAQASYQQAAEMSCKLSAQLRSAEDRIRELETKLRHHEERADRAERWLRSAETGRSPCTVSKSAHDYHGMHAQARAAVA